MSTHFNLRYFKCDHCEASFSRKWTLKKHSYTHTGEKPFKCRFCKKKFADKSNMATHMKRHLKIKNEKEDLEQIFAEINESVDLKDDSVNCKMTRTKSGLSNEFLPTFHKSDSRNVLNSTTHHGDNEFIDCFDNHEGYDNFESLDKLSNHENLSNLENFLKYESFFTLKIEKEEDDTDNLIYELFKDGNNYFQA